MPTIDDALLERLGRELGGTPSGLRRLSGGASRVTSALDLERADGSRWALVLQVDRVAGTGLPGGVGTEAQLLAAAREAGVPVAAVVSVGRTDDGRGWLLLERLDGETIARRILRDGAWATARSRLAEQCGQALAAIHRIEAASVERLPEHDPVGEPLGVLDALGEVRPVLELGARWLARRPPTPRRRTVVHGDFRLGNLLVGPDGLRAVLDWELAHLGDPASDLGWLCARAWRFGSPARVGGFGELDELLDAYAAAGGERVDPLDVTWWEAQAALRWAAICAMQASAHLGGAVRSVELATIGRRVCECEWDLLDSLGLVTTDVAHPTTRSSPAPRAEVPAPFGHPTLDELLEAVEGHLMERRAREGESDRFTSRVAGHAVAIARRELADGGAMADAHRARLADLGFEDDAALAAALRSGALDADLATLGRALAASVRDQVLVANPGYLGSA